MKNEEYFWIISNKEETQFLVIDWNICDTIDGVDWTKNIEDCDHLSDDYKMLIDDRQILLQEYNAHWVKIRRTTTVEIEKIT